MLPRLHNIDHIMYSWCYLVRKYPAKNRYLPIVTLCMGRDQVMMVSILTGQVTVGTVI